MTKIILQILLLVCIINEQDYSQAYKDNWSISFGGSYPRYISISEKSLSDNNNYGIFSSLGYNISRHTSLRVNAAFLSMESFYYVSYQEVLNTVKMGSINFDAIYTPKPCDDLIPYGLVGLGVSVFNSDEPYSSQLDKTYFGYQLNLGLGGEYKLDSKWSAIIELDYITSSNNKIDGNFSTNLNKGLFDGNGDTYVTLNFGIKYYLDNSNSINICEPPSGIKDYNIPIEIDKISVDTSSTQEGERTLNNLEISGENFSFNKSILNNDSQANLDYVVSVLGENPEINLEIHGHTDNIGTDQYNQNLSLRRAETVKNYLIYNGISSKRLISIGFGEKFPKYNNKTSSGRANNRRIEFKIIQ